MIAISAGGRSLRVFPAADAAAPLIVLSTFQDGGMDVWKETKALTDADFSLAAVSCNDWSGDMTPWPHGEYSGNADGYLEALEREIIPAAIGVCGLEPGYMAAAGYSLGGLLSLYAAYRTGLFSRLASASGSLWYPGFVDFAGSHSMIRKPERIYLSLGAKEKKTRNAEMRCVEESTRAFCSLCRDRGICTLSEMNPGNHFTEPAKRMAKGIRWLLEG